MASDITSYQAVGRASLGAKSGRFGTWPFPFLRRHLSGIAHDLAHSDQHRMSRCPKFSRLQGDKSADSARQKLAGSTAPSSQSRKCARPRSVRGEGNNFDRAVQIPSFANTFGWSVENGLISPAIFSRAVRMCCPRPIVVLPQAIACVYWRRDESGADRSCLCRARRKP